MYRLTEGLQRGGPKSLQPWTTPPTGEKWLSGVGGTESATGLIPEQARNCWSSASQVSWGLRGARRHNRWIPRDQDKRFREYDVVVGNEQGMAPNRKLITWEVHQASLEWLRHLQIRQICRTLSRHDLMRVVYWPPTLDSIDSRPPSAYCGAKEPSENLSPLNFCMTGSRVLVRCIFISTLAVLPAIPQAGQGYTNVYLSVSAPKAWFAEITDALKVKLNAIPDVQVVDKEDDSLFTIAVDVNAVTNKGDDLIGYSMMALICGTYDRKVLDFVFTNMENSSKDKDLAAVVKLMKYAAAGNVFLAATVHTHGSVENIDTAYDEIVGQFKTKALPELRRFATLVDELDTSKNTALPRSRF